MQASVARNLNTVAALPSRRVLLAKARGELDGADDFAAVVYTVPSHQNPTGAVMPADARRRLVRLAREHRLLVIADDVYELLHYGAPQQQRLVAYDLTPCPQRGTTAGNVLSNSTFSKIFGPGVRCGWIEAAEPLIASLAASAVVSSSGANAQLTGGILTSVMASGEQDSLLDHTIGALRERMQRLQAAFREHAPPGYTLSAPTGGMCAWLTMPAYVDSHAVLMEARRRGVSFKPGDLFSSAPPGSPKSSRNCCRVVVAHYDAESLAAAARTLCEVCRDLDPSFRRMAGHGTVVYPRLDLRASAMR